MKRIADPRPLQRTRRRLIAGIAGSFVLPLSATSQADPLVDTIVPVIKDVTRGASIKPGRVKLQVPQVADNGNSVPLKVTVDSPMTDADHVRSIFLFAEKNPRPVIAKFYLGPRAGRAEIATRVRLAGTQRLIAVAEMGDGSLWSDVAEVIVTLAACIDGS